MKKFASLISLAALLVSTSTARTALALNNTYQLLDNTVIPNGDGTVTSFAAWANALFVVVISLIAGIAVIKIAYGGLQYILSATSGGKSEGKQSITDAFWGLGLALTAWFILNIINPDLVKFPEFLSR
jgi:hypothetical protein